MIRAGLVSKVGMGIPDRLELRSCVRRLRGTRKLSSGVYRFRAPRRSHLPNRKRGTNSNTMAANCFGHTCALGPNMAATAMIETIMAAKKGTRTLALGNGV